MIVHEVDVIIVVKKVTCLVNVPKEVKEVGAGAGVVVVEGGEIEVEELVSVEVISFEEASG